MEINVNYIVEGSFQLVGSEARLIIQLINTKDGSHLWSNEYDRDWSDIFKVQSEVSQTIAKEIAVNITPETKEVIETIPTNDLTAYDYYLKGKEYQQRSTYEEDFRIAIQMYEKAVKIDSAFVLAWVGLASASRQIYWFYYDRSKEQLLRINEYLGRALSLSPNLKEVQLEEGSYYYHCKLDYPKALQILEPLKSKYPHDEEIYKMISFVYRRMGNFSKSLQYNDFAISLNRSNWNLWINAGITLRVLRKYNNAERYFKRAIELNPSNHILYDELLRLYAITGQIKKAREFLQNNQRIIDEPEIKLTQAYIEVLDGNYEDALQITESLSEEVVNDQGYYHTKHSQLGLIYLLMSNKEMAAKHFESEKVFLLEKMDKFQNDSRIYRSLGLAYAGLGMNKEAVEAGEIALGILSSSNDAHGGYDSEMDMVKILVMVGEYEDALTRLEYIISQNGEITAEVLKLDPFWNPVRDMDKFQEIISNPKYQISLLDN
jgi:tetratricopeptide (TPR) repeat protein